MAILGLSSSTKKKREVRITLTLTLLPTPHNLIIKVDNVRGISSRLPHFLPTSKIASYSSTGLFTLHPTKTLHSITTLTAV